MKKIEENATKSCIVQYYSTAVVSFLIKKIRLNSRGVLHEGPKK